MMLARRAGATLCTLRSEQRWYLIFIMNWHSEARHANAACPVQEVSEPPSYATFA
jgi:hypothetical protein